MQATETHPPAKTLLVVRTGASVVEMKAPAIARESSRSNLSDGPSPSQHSRHLRSVNDLPVGIPDLDLAKIELLHVFFYLRAVAYRKNDRLFRQNVFSRPCLRLLGRHGIDAIRKIRIVVQRQIVS